MLEFVWWRIGEIILLTKQKVDFKKLDLAYTVYDQKYVDFQTNAVDNCVSSHILLTYKHQNVGNF